MYVFASSIVADGWIRDLHVSTVPAEVLKLKEERGTTAATDCASHIFIHGPLLPSQWNSC